MLVLKFNKDKENVKKKRHVFRRKKDNINIPELNRYSINVNGKQVLVLELTERELIDENVTALLKIYKGKVLVPEGYKNVEVLKEYLFEPKEYYQRAVLSSLKKQIRTVNKEWNNICIKFDNFSPFQEFFEIVQLSKSVNLITPKNPQSIKFVNDCYNEFGAIVFLNGAYSSERSVLLDLDKIDSSGRLLIKVKEKDFILYPDTTYFQQKDEFKKLSTFNVEHNIICAAFSN